MPDFKILIQCPVCSLELSSDTVLIEYDATRDRGQFLRFAQENHDHLRPWCSHKFKQIKVGSDDSTGYGELIVPDQS